MGNKSFRINKRLTWLIISSIVYFTAIHTEIGFLLLLPIELLVTFLHEFSHALTCILTGGSVISLETNLDCSGATITSGGNYTLICIGGYIGSCIFSNLLMRCSLDERLSKMAAMGIALSSIFTAIIWYSNDLTSTILVVLSIIFLIIAKLHRIQSFLLQFISIASLISIIQDFNVGPTSDLQAFTAEIPIFTQTVWMYIWLLIVLVITIWNMRRILRNF